jgi:hypothetical protein
MKLQTLEIICDNGDSYTINVSDIVDFRKFDGETVLRLNNKNYKPSCHRHNDDRMPTFVDRMREWGDVYIILLNYDNGKQITHEFYNTSQRANVDRGELVVEIYH